MESKKNKLNRFVSGLTESTTNVVSNMAEGTTNVVNSAVMKTKETINTSKDSVIGALDQNGDGQIGIDDIISLGLNTPGVQVDRETFLRKELRKYCSQEQIDKAVETNPAKANIDPEVIENVYQNVVQFERNCVSGISAALGAPGGFTMVATIPADIIQYYGYLLRATQKTLYLYGFPDLNTQEVDNQLDSETLNILILCMGAMYGAAGANNAIKGVSVALSRGVEKQLLSKALTKGTFYPMVKSTMKWFNVNLTKKVFAGFFRKTIPVIGGVIGGGITYLTFKPCCDKLKEAVEDTIMTEYDSPVEVIDVI